MDSRDEGNEMFKTERRERGGFGEPQTLRVPRKFRHKTDTIEFPGVRDYNAARVLFIGVGVGFWK